jgi:hemerythrin-like domain-containing protein
MKNPEPEVITQLKRDHENMRRVIDVLGSQLERHQQRRRVSDDLLAEIVDYLIHYPDMWHHPKEDVIFKRLITRCPDCELLVRGIMLEHRELAEHNRRLAAALYNIRMKFDLPAGWLQSHISKCIDKNLHHMRKEDEFYFPLASRELTDEDWKWIETEISMWKKTPLISDEVLAGYPQLADELKQFESDV